MDSVERRGDPPSQRILKYLQAREDLTLETKVVDAASQSDMADLVRGIKRPLGGCVLLAGLLSDGMFATQSKEGFERVFPPKLGAFRALESAVDLASIDFVVAFSSVSGMFGNPGQTNYAAYVDHGFLSSLS